MSIQQPNAINAAVKWDINPGSTASPARVASDPGGAKTVENGDSFTFEINGVAAAWTFNSSSGGNLAPATIVAGSAIAGAGAGDATMSSSGATFAVESAATGAGETLDTFANATELIAAGHAEPYQSPDPLAGVNFIIRCDGVVYIAPYSTGDFAVPKTADEVIAFFEPLFVPTLTGSPVKLVNRSGTFAVVSSLPANLLGSNQDYLDNIFAFVGAQPHDSVPVDVLGNLDIDPAASSTGTNAVAPTNTQAGSGATVARSGIGTYRITLERNAAGAACELVGVNGGTGAIVAIDEVDDTTRAVKIVDADNIPVDAPASFVSIRY